MKGWLSKSVVVMDKTPDMTPLEGWDAKVRFGVLDEDDPSRWTHEMHLPAQTWEDMGSPAQVTVRITPGDFLNEH